MRLLRDEPLTVVGLVIGRASVIIAGFGADVLQALGFSFSDAKGIVDRFREHDEKLLRDNFSYAKDLPKLQELADKSRRELEAIFNGD